MLKLMFDVCGLLGSEGVVYWVVRVVMLFVYEMGID